MLSGFFDNTEVVAEDFARFAAGLLTDGVLADVPTALQVTFGGGMKVAVLPGYCWIEGHYGKAEAPEVLTLERASGTLGRIDRIVARLDYNSSSVYLAVLKGTEAADPAPPNIVRDGSVYDLGLATVTLEAGTTEITSAMIVDTRGESTVCGFTIFRNADALALDSKADRTELIETNESVEINRHDIQELQGRNIKVRNLINEPITGLLEQTGIGASVAWEWDISLPEISDYNLIKINGYVTNSYNKFSIGSVYFGQNDDFKKEVIAQDYDFDLFNYAEITVKREGTTVSVYAKRIAENHTTSPSISDLPISSVTITEILGVTIA